MRKLIPVIIICFCTTPLFSQKWKLTRYEVSLGAGFSNLFGDIGGSATPNNWFGIKDIDILGTRPTLTGGARYKITQDMAIKLNMNIVMFGGSDKGSKNATRNHSFNSYGNEHSLQFEYYFKSEDKSRGSFARFNRRGMLNNYSKIGMYVFGALGGIYTYTNFKIGWKDSNGNLTNQLQSGEVVKNSNYAPVGAIGIGAKLIYSNKYALSAEFGPRYAYGDFLDGFTYTLSKNPFNDVYYFTSISLVYRIKTSRKGYPILFRSY